jgi:hypothetical protein
MALARMIRQEHVRQLRISMRCLWRVEAPSLPLLAKPVARKPGTRSATGGKRGENDEHMLRLHDASSSVTRRGRPRLRHRYPPVRAQPPGGPRPGMGPVCPPADAPRASCDRQPRERLERPTYLEDRPGHAARGPRREDCLPHRAHPSGPSARLPDGPRAPRSGRRRGRRRVLAGPPRRADRPAVPERGRRALLRAVRGLHAREVLPLVAGRRLRPPGGDIRRLRMSTTGPPSGSSRRPVRTRFPGDRRSPAGPAFTFSIVVLAFSDNAARVTSMPGT